MYLKTKNKVLELIETLKEAVKYIRVHPEVSEDHLKQCVQALSIINPILEKESNAIRQILEQVELFLQKILYEEQTIEEWDALLKDLQGSLQSFSKMVKDIVPRLKVFFLPYKAEMWTALESIWQAFSKDPLCDTYVMPIPYHTLKFTQTGEIIKDRFCYEADKYPQEVPIVNYAQVDLALEQPDAVFIHNPYDENNNLTRVPEQYYSRNLRSVTDMLVYSPYFTVSGFDPKTQRGNLLTAALQYAHWTIVQSEKLAKIYQSFGVSRGKLLIYGSPKIDAIVRNVHNTDYVPQEWKVKLKGKTVFLLNTHLSFFLRKSSDEWKYPLEEIRHLLQYLKEHSEYAIIWRPHPLMVSMMKSRGYHVLVKEMESIMAEARMIDGFIIDDQASYLPAFVASHAMFSSYSSLVNEYMVTQKPIMFIGTAYIKYGPSNYETMFKNGVVNLENNYFTSDYEETFQRYDPKVKIGMDLALQVINHSHDAFMKMVHEGKDPKKEKRMKNIKEGFTCMDGTSGEKIYKMIKSKII